VTSAGARPPGLLWRDRGFAVFLAAQTLSVAGDSFALIALPLLVLRATGSVAQMGLLTGVAGAAAIVAGIFAGSLADRLDRWRLMLGCDLARMVLYGLTPLAWAVDPQVWLLYVILPVCAAIGMVFEVTYVTVIPALAGPDRITEANGLLYATAAAAGIAGPLLAGLVSGMFGPAGAVAVDAASFAVSAAGLLLVRRWQPARPGSGAGAADGAGAGRGQGWRDLLAGARFLWRQPVLRALTVMLAIFIFATYGLTDVLIYYLKHDLGQPDGVVGLVLGAAAVGTVGGALAVAPLRRKLGFGRCWIGSLVLAGLAVGGLGAAGQVPAVAGLAACYLACVSVAGICSMSLRQQLTPDYLLGRVTAAFWTIHFAPGPVGAALLTWTAGHAGVTATCLASGAVCLLLGLAAMDSPIRQAA
jgi:Na+/melibiose symporter-like transporter